MFKSVFAKYILTFMLIIFVSFLVLVLIITGMVNSYAVNAKEKLLSNAASGAAEFLEARTETLSKTNFTQMIEGSVEDVDRMQHCQPFQSDASRLSAGQDGPAGAEHSYLFPYVLCRR